MWVSQHVENPRKQPDPERFPTSVEKLGAISSEKEHRRIFLYGELQKLHSLRSLRLQVFTIGEGIIPLETVELDAGIDVDQHVVVLAVILWRLEKSGVILDVLYGLKKTFEFAVFVRS